MSLAWYDVDQGRQVFEEFVTGVNDLAETLHVPAGEDVWWAGQEALEDSIKAVTSGSHFLFIVAQPWVRAMGWIVYWIGWFIWKYVVVEGLYNHGLSQAKEWLLKYWEWQTSLSQEELLIEAAVIVSFLGLYRLHLFLKRRKYLQKAAVWMDRKKRSWVKNYNKLIQKVAKVSLVLAAMVSHIGFLVAAAGVRLLLPALYNALAKPKVIGMLSFWGPLFFTITALFEFKEEQRINELASEGDPNRKKSKKKRRTTLGSKLRRRSAGVISITSSEPTLDEELDDWLRFWMVRGAVEALKGLTYWVTPTWFQAAMVQLELAFYVWIYCLPFIQPDTLAGQTLPEARPLRVMCSFLGPYSRSVVEAVSGAIPLDKWQTYVVENARKLMPALVFVRFMKQETADWLVHALEVGRGMVIPGLTLFSPFFITRYGVVYVQFLMPISKSDDGEKELWLKYWVLHAMADGLLYHFASFLWWVPLSTHLTFVLWCYLSIPQSTERWYAVVETEFKHFGLLPGEHEGSYENTFTVQFFTWIYELLPKADDAVEDENINDDDASNGPKDANDSPKGASKENPIVLEDETERGATAAKQEQSANPVKKAESSNPPQQFVKSVEHSQEDEDRNIGIVATDTLSTADEDIGIAPTDTITTVDDDDDNGYHASGPESPASAASSAGDDGYDDGYQPSGPESPASAGDFNDIDLSDDSLRKPDPPETRSRRRSARVATRAAN